VVVGRAALPVHNGMSRLTACIVPFQARPPEFQARHADTLLWSITPAAGGLQLTGIYYVEFGNPLVYLATRNGYKGWWT